MINYNKFNINILSVFISLIIFSIIIFILNFPNTKIKNKKISLSNNVEIAEDISIFNVEKWNLEIKKLNVNSEIEEMENDVPGESKIGHFKETSINGKNIALIAYNFGKSKNIFTNLKELEPNDEIVYTVNDNIRKYKVLNNQIIDKQSLNLYLNENNDSESYLKLFTYISNLDNKLRYVCAEEVIDI